MFSLFSHKGDVCVGGKSWNKTLIDVCKGESLGDVSRLCSCRSYVNDWSGLATKDSSSVAGSINGIGGLNTCPGCKAGCVGGDDGVNGVASGFSGE